MCHTSSHPSVGLVSRGQPGLLFNRSRWPICTRGSSMEGHCPVPRQGVGRFHGSQQSGKFLLWYMTNVKCDLHTIRQYWFLICVYDQSKTGKDLECHAIGAIAPWNNCRIIQHLDVQKLEKKALFEHCVLCQHVWTYMSLRVCSSTTLYTENRKRLTPSRRETSTSGSWPAVQSTWPQCSKWVTEYVLSSWIQYNLLSLVLISVCLVFPPFPFRNLWQLETHV